MQVAPDRISAADPEIHYAGNREHSFRTESFPEGILLPGLPFHLGKRRRSAPAARGLGDIQLIATGDQKFQIPKPKLQRACGGPVFDYWYLGFVLEFGFWDLELRRDALKIASGPEPHGHNSFFNDVHPAP